MSREFYVIDTRTNRIVNCITTSGEMPTLDPQRWMSAEHLRLDEHPTRSQLEAYEYWNGRP